MIKLSIKRNELEINLEADGLTSDEMKGLVGHITNFVKGINPTVKDKMEQRNNLRSVMRETKGTPVVQSSSEKEGVSNE
ncbi:MULTISPECIES: hypothetical protein [Bacillus]|uniref:hypothetical protein n=1 Tax=Bacillus TaxID=1386 RepID=UPI002021142D|nr:MULTISPECIES: hypothetical protein [Bacillus]MCL7873843.1 hypothetical protein [Bacillus altitudinis]MCP1147362.1 hypothetical protein [Bacillus sp. 1735sda2]